MAGFTIPNTPNAYNQNQAEPDSLDFQILGDNNKGVVSGMAVTPNSSSVVNVALGEIYLNGTYYPYAGGTGSLTTRSGDYSSASFFDLIVARVNLSAPIESAVSIATIAGTTSNQRFGAIVDATDVVLAAVWREPGSPEIVDATRIVDKRHLLRPVPTRVTATSPSGGTTGDLYVRSNWSEGTNGATNMDSPLSVNVGGTFYTVAKWPSDNNIISTGSITAGSFSTTGTLSAGATTVTSLSVSGGNITSVANITATTVTAALSGNASTATLASKASTLAMGGGNGTAMTFNWSGKSGQPTWLWGSDDGSSHYVYNPSNFRVANSNTLGDRSPAVTAFGGGSGTWYDPYYANANTIPVRDGYGRIEIWDILLFRNSDYPKAGFWYQNPSGGYVKLFSADSSNLGNSTGSPKPVYVGTDGNIYSYNSSSQRFKQDVASYEWDVAKILNIETVSFKYNNDRPEYENGNTYYGVIAEQVEGLGLTELLTYEIDGPVEGFKYDVLPIALLSVVKSLDARIKKLEAKK